MSRYQGTPQFRAQACVIAHQWLVRKAKTTGTRRVQRDSMGTDPIAAEIYPRGHNLFRAFHLGFFAQPRNQLISATTSNVPQDEHRYASVFPVNGSRRRLLPSAGLKYKSLLGRPGSERNRFFIPMVPGCMSPWHFGHFICDSPIVIARRLTETGGG